MNQLALYDDAACGHYTLSELFMFSPFSVLDTRARDWQARKKKWLSLGIKSELGRKENITSAPERTSYMRGSCTHCAPGTSVFDPVLCEVMYKWFCTPGGKILDPFAGGSVRGIVASYLGYDYHGNDLRPEQIAANIGNAEDVGVTMPTWTVGDSGDIFNLAGPGPYDMIFSCPPYYDLEVYSDRSDDLSNMEWCDFVLAYRHIISESCDMLSDDRFAVFVVGDVRDSRGFYRDLISVTKDAFMAAGCNLYNEIIKIDPYGNAGMRARRQFATRKCTKIHQNVLVFYKGDPSRIKGNYGEITIETIGG